MAARNVKVQYLRKGDLVQDWENRRTTLELPFDPQFSSGTTYRISVRRRDGIAESHFNGMQEMTVLNLPPPVELPRFICEAIEILEEKGARLHGAADELMQDAERLGLKHSADWIYQNYGRFVNAMRCGYVPTDEQI